MDNQDFTLAMSDDDLETLRGANGVLALTDSGREEILVIERRVAAQLAAMLHTTLYLADRSVRTWTETPHVRGPADVDELRRLGVTYMVDQMEEALALGVRGVMGLAPSIPTFDAILDALESSNADIVVTPTHLDHLRLFDRLQLHGDLSAAVKEKVGDRHVVVVGPDGGTTLL